MHCLTERIGPPCVRPGQRLWEPHCPVVPARLACGLRRGSAWPACCFLANVPDFTHPSEKPQSRLATWLTPLCDIPSGCCFFTGPWTVTRSSIRMLRRVAAFCRPLRPLLLLVSFPCSRSPVVGVPGLCWMGHGVLFAHQWCPVVGVLRLRWLLPALFDCFCCPRASVHRPSVTCVSVCMRPRCPAPPHVPTVHHMSLSPSRLVCPWWAPTPAAQTAHVGCRRHPPPDAG